MIDWNLSLICIKIRFKNIGYYVAKATNESKRVLIRKYYNDGTLLLNLTQV